MVADEMACVGRVVAAPNRLWLLHCANQAACVGLPTDSQLEVFGQCRVERYVKVI